MLLVGDQHQMPSVGAGGGFAYAAANAGTVAELTVNRRQRAEWEQQALAALRNGSVPTPSAPTSNTAGSWSPPMPAR